MSQMLIALAVFAGLVVYMTTMLCLTYMLSLIILKVSNISI
jgi:hypothetical protein